MKILLINNLFPPYIVGGNEILAKDVIDELRCRGHAVHVLTGHGRDLPRDDLTHGDLDLDLDRKAESFLGQKQPTLVDILNWHLFNFRSYAATLRAIRRIGPDLVIIWNLYMASMAPLIATRHSGKPSVIQLADKWLFYSLTNIEDLVRPERMNHKRALRFAHACLQPILRALAAPKHIVTISEFMRRFYIAQGFRAADLTAIHLGVPTQVFTALPRQSSSSNATHLLYIGSLWAGKGPHIAVKAIGQLVRKGIVGLTLDMYGEGTDQFKTWLRNIIEQEGLVDRVFLRGFGTRAEILAALHSHEILVFPSLSDEPFAAVPIEAMSCGLAVVATTAGGTPEAITHNETGLLVAPDDVSALADGIESLILDEALRQRLGVNAARHVREQLDFAGYVNRLEAYYAGILNPA